MSKKKKFSTSFLIGIFVLSGLTLLVGFILWMGATQFFKEYDYYVTYFEDSVGGLENGSSVKYLGVPCGLVHDISIAPDGKLVQVVIKIDKNLQIHDSLVIQQEMAGLAGGKYLQLTSARNTMINDFDFSFELPYPYLYSAPSSLDEIAQSAGSIITDLKQIKWKNISDGLDGTLEGTNRLIHNKNLELILSDLRETTQALNDLVKNLNQRAITSNLENTSFAVSNAAAQLEQFSTNLNVQLEELNIPTYLDKYYIDFNQTLGTVNGVIEGTATQFRTSILGINILLEDLEQTNKILQKTLRNVNESPYMFLTEPPPKEEIKIKTKK